MFKKYFLVLFCLSFLFMVGCNEVNEEISLTCTLKDETETLTFKFFYENKDAVRPKRVEGVGIFSNLDYSNVQDVESSKCSLNADECFAKFIDDGYELNCYYDVTDEKDIPYGNYDSVVEMLEESDFVCN